MEKKKLGSFEELSDMPPEKLALKIKGAEVGVEKPSAPSEDKPVQKKYEPKFDDKKKSDKGNGKKKLIDTGDEYVPPDNVDALLDNISDEDLMRRADEVLRTRRAKKFRDYIKDMIDQGMKGTPDKLVKRALAEISADRKAKKNKFADDYSDDDYGDD
jgi:hypothetical protein